MIFHETKLHGAYIVDINRIEDERGFFGRSWCKQEFEEHELRVAEIESLIKNGELWDGMSIAAFTLYRLKVLDKV